MSQNVNKNNRKKPNFVLPFWKQIVLVAWFHCQFERSFFVWFSLPLYTFIIEILIITLKLFSIEISLEISILPIVIFVFFYIAFYIWLYRTTNVLLSKYNNKYYDNIIYKIPKLILVLSFLLIFLFSISIIYYEFILQMWETGKFTLRIAEVLQIQRSRGAGAMLPELIIEEGNEYTTS